MEFFIKRNATLPVLKLQVVKDGRSDYNNFMELLETSSIFFSMVNSETGIPKIISKPAGFVEKTFIDPNAEPEYYIYYQFTNTDTNLIGKYEGQFLVKTDDGNLILPIREKLFIYVQDSFIADDLTYENCYTSVYPCCIGPGYPTPTPSVTPTPTPQILINPIITENDEYIEVGNNEYLQFVNPTIEYNIDVYVSSGSVVTTFTVTTNIAVNQITTIPINAILDVVGGDSITITANVIILPSQLIGQSINTNPLIDYNLLTRQGEITVGVITPNNFPTFITANILQFEQEPTPTPTQTPTQTPTPTPTQTSTLTPTPTPDPLVPLTLYIQSLSGGQSIIFNGVTYTGDTTVNIQKNVFYNIQAVPIPGYMFVGWNVFGASFSSTAQTTTVSVSLDSGANLAPSYSVDPNYDALESQLTTSLISYQNATINDWVKITKTEYDNIFNNVDGVTKIGNNDKQINNRAVATGYLTTTFGTVDANTPLTIPTGYYVVGFISESWNQTGYTQLGYTTTFHTGAPTYMGNSPEVSPGTRGYYVRKKPSGVEGAPATQNLYPVLNFISPAYPNAVPNTFGWQTPDGGTTWIETDSNSQTAKIQILITNTATWPT